MHNRNKELFSVAQVRFIRKRPARRLANSLRGAGRGKLPPKQKGKVVNTMKKTKNLMIGAGILLFIFFIIFAMAAGTRIGTDIGEFIYNIKH